MAAGLVSGPAQAQETPQDARMTEMGCVYFGVVELADDDFFAIGDMMLKNQSEGEGLERLASMVADVADVCALQYAWDDTQAGYAVELGLQGVLSDTLAADMITLGMTEEQLRKIETLIDTMSEENFDRLYFGTWREIAADRAELDKLWVENGAPSIPGILERVPVYLEASLVTLDLIDRWAADYPL